MSHVQLQAFCQFARMRQNLATFEGRQSCERLGVEARVFEAKTAIHRVGSKFERLLLNIVLDLTRERYRGTSQREATYLHQLCR